LQDPAEVLKVMHFLKHLGEVSLNLPILLLLLTAPGFLPGLPKTVHHPADIGGDVLALLYLHT
ncbi:hypothetical protein M9458_036136, partial [Cirrhinus mrigala]